MIINRRSLLKGFAAAVAAVPLASIESKLPDIPVSRSLASGLRNSSAWATITSGRITSIVITSCGSGYKCPPVLRIGK